MSGWICSQSDWWSGEWEHGYHKRGPAAAISDPGGNFPSTETGRKLGRVASHQQTPQTSFEISPFRPPTHSPLYLDQCSFSPLFLFNPSILHHNGLPHSVESHPCSSGQAAQRTGSQDLRLCHQCLCQAHRPRCGRLGPAAAGARSQDHRLRWHEGGRLWCVLPDSIDPMLAPS